MTLLAYAISALVAATLIALMAGVVVGTVGMLVVFAKATGELKFLRERMEDRERAAEELVERANKIITRRLLGDFFHHTSDAETDTTKN